MSLINNITKILADSVSTDQQESVDYIGSILNQFMEDVRNTVNGRLDYDNLDKQLITLEISVNSSGVPIRNNQFISDYTILRGHNVINVVNTTNSTNYPTSKPYVVFEGNGQGTYTIKKITGLPSDDTFQLLIELIP